LTTRSERILVTGALGQIGSELVPELRKRYHNERVIASDYRIPVREASERQPFEQLDVTDKEAIASVVRRYDIDTVYHLAGILSAAGERNPTETWRVNIEGLRNVLEVAREQNITKLFWPSSIAVFGPAAPKIDTPQDVALVPKTIYGITKVAGELLCNYYFSRYGLDIRSVRYPGVISSDAPPGGGTTDYAVEIFYEAVKRKRYICFVRENTVLPMLYMPDCIRGTLDLMEADSSKISIRTSYNLMGLNFSAGELAREIKKHIPAFDCAYQPDYRQEIADSWPRSVNDALARKDWNWEPKYDLPSMTEDMLSRLEKMKALELKEK
jgi:nucleoside-diphosphate-sugar epimerase